MPVTAINNTNYGGPTEERPIKDSKSLGEYLLQCLEEQGDKVVLVGGNNGIQATAHQIKENFINFALKLRALGVKEGNAVGICCENRMEFADTVFATCMLNATLAPFNVTYTERELNHAFSLSKPKVIFASSATAAVAQKNSIVKHVVCFEDAIPSRNVLRHSMFLKLLRDKPKAPFKVKLDNVREHLERQLVGGNGQIFCSGVATKIQHRKQ